MQTKTSVYIFTCSLFDVHTHYPLDNTHVTKNIHQGPRDQFCGGRGGPLMNFQTVSFLYPNEKI